MYKKYSVIVFTMLILSGCGRNPLPNASHMGTDNTYSSFDLKTDNNVPANSSVSVNNGATSFDSTNGVTLSKQEIANQDLYSQPNNITNYTDGDIRNGVNKLNNADNYISGPNYTSSVNRNHNSVVGVNTWDDQLTLNENEDKQIRAYSSYEDGTSVDALNWKSSDESVAKVDSSGNVYAVSEGEATITATSTDNFSKQADIPVTVKSNDESTDE